MVRAVASRSDAAMLQLALATLLSAAVVALFLLTEPVPQDPAYHLFADTRRLLSVSNFWNVMSNLPFLIVGLWGLWIVKTMPINSQKIVPHSAYYVFFLGVLLTAFGSSYYHLAPANETLFWDRLPMTIAFAGLFSLVISEYLSPTLGARLLLPFLVVGIGSVIYWVWTESRGAGDLRPYAVVQFLPMLAIPAILLLRLGDKPLTRTLVIMIGFYVAAKVFEHFDKDVYSVTFLSGHSLKHLFAAAAPAAMILGLRHRMKNEARTT